MVYIPVNSFLVMLQQFPVFLVEPVLNSRYQYSVLLKDTTQFSGGESQTSYSSIPSLMLYQLDHSSPLEILVLRPNKKISVFRVMGLKILGREGTHFFVIIVFLEKK